MANLTHVCLLTDDVAGLAAFYTSLLSTERGINRPEYVEIPTLGAIVAIFSIDDHHRIAPGASDARSNRSVMVEFEVPNLDDELARLKDQPIEWVTQPTTHSWGTRSVYLRDPDGNLISLYEQIESDSA